MKNIEFNNKFPALTARRYGIFILGEHGSVLLDPTPFALAEAFLTPRSKLETIIHSWEYSESGVKEGIIKFPGVRGYRDLLENVNKESLIESIQQGMIKEYKRNKIWHHGSKNTAVKSIKLKRDQVRRNKKPYGGGTVLAGEVAAAFKGHRLSFIKGPFENSAHPFYYIWSGTHDVYHTAMKGGWSNMSHTDFPAALLLTYAHQNPDKIKEKYANRKIARPFIFSNQDIADALIARFVGRWNNPRTSQMLMKNIEISNQLGDMIEDRKANFGVILEKQQKNVYDPVVMKFLGKIHYDLLNKGYSKHGFCIEFAGTPHQAVAEDYSKVTGEPGDQFLHNARVYTNGAPPLIIYRKKKLPFSGQPRNDKINNPWEEIFSKKGVIDDSTSESTFFQVRIPLKAEMKIHGSIRADYHKALQNIPNDKKTLRKNIKTAQINENNNFYKAFINMTYGPKK